MRWMRFLLCASCLVGASDAQGAIEADVALFPKRPPDPGPQAITYPGQTVVDVRLRGLEPGRTYSVRAVVLDANQQTVAEHTWRAMSPSADKRFFELLPSARSEPGMWRIVLEANGERIAEQSLLAKRLPPLTPERALVATSVNRNLEPRRPLAILGIPSAAYYYIETSGFVPGRQYQYRIAVTDGAGKIVRDQKFPRQASKPRQIEWFPVVARATDAPGTWTLRFELDNELVAQTTIEARPGASRANTAYLERWWPAVAAALLLIVLYVGYSLATVPRVAAASAPVVPAPRLLDASLATLVVANLLPIVFVVYANASAKELLFVYWCETFIIAAYAIPRILIARRVGPEDYTGSGVVAVTIFLLIFGLLSVSWGLGIFYFLADRSGLFELNPRQTLGLQAVAHQPFDLWSAMPIPVELAYMIAALFVSHGLSFVNDYLKSGAYLLTSQKAEAMRPWNRMALSYVAFVAMGIVGFTAQGSAELMLVILVVLKTVADVTAHLRARAGAPSILKSS